MKQVAIVADQNHLDDDILGKPAQTTLRLAVESDGGVWLGYEYIGTEGKNGYLISKFKAKDSV